MRFNKAYDVTIRLVTEETDIQGSYRNKMKYIRKYAMKYIDIEIKYYKQGKEVSVFVSTSHILDKQNSLEDCDLILI